MAGALQDTIAARMSNPVALPNGTELASDFRIERVLGAGGFGITYLARELSLGLPVTIKEYFPADFAARAGDAAAAPRSLDCAGDYQWGLERFLAEARTLAKFSHPNIVRVRRYFPANNTGYMVLHFEEGETLKAWLKDLRRAPRQQEIDAILAPLLDALEYIHKADFLHRDIAPDNIIIRKDGAPVLIDFGSARGELAQHSRTVSALVKPGYSPYEQYGEEGKKQGPWTDIYALAATLYHAITGKRPPDAPSRMVQDEFVPAGEAQLASYRPRFLRAIDRALALQIDARPQSIAAWRGELLAPEPASGSRSGKPGWFTRALDKKEKRDAAPPFPAEPQAKDNAAAIPPPPDAPGPKGRLLDFLDKVKATVEPPAAAATSATQPEPEPASEVRPPPRILAPSARKPPRPRPMRTGPSRVRPLLFKFLIGVGVASAAVALQDNLRAALRDMLPRIESRGGAAPTSQNDRLELIAVLRGHAGAVVSAAYAADGRAIVTAGTDGTARVWNASGGLLRTIELDHGPAISMAVQGNRLLTGHGEGQIDLWDLDRADKIASFRRNEANIWAVVFAGDPDRFAAAGHDWKVSLWDARLKEGPVHVFEGHESAVKALAFAPSGPYLASAGADRTVRLWNLETLDLARAFRGHRDFVTALAFSPDGRVLASAALDGQIRLWSSSSGRLARILTGHKGRVGGLAFSPSGAFLASCGDDGAVRLWDVRRGRAAKTLVGHAGAARAVAFSPEGDRLVSASDDGTARLWSPQILRRDPPRDASR